MKITLLCDTPDSYIHEHIDEIKKIIRRKKHKVVFVKNKNGRVVRVTFGDPNLGAHPGNKKRKKSYCARSKSLGNDKTKANYWSRRQWKC